MAKYIEEDQMSKNRKSRAKEILIKISQINQKTNKLTITDIRRANKEYSKISKYSGIKIEIEEEDKK